MTKSQEHVLQAVFGYKSGLVTSPGHALMVHRTQGRIMEAARQLAKIGIIHIDDDTGLDGCVRITRAA